MDSLQKGFWSGVMATSVMTLAMLAAEETNPEPLPPAELADDLTPEAIKPETSNRRSDTTMIAHFGFGVALATLYSLLQGREKTTTIKDAVQKGSAFGLLIWTSSYLGWIPGLGYRPAAKKLSFATNNMMIGAHIVYGSVLGFVNRILSRAGNQILDGKEMIGHA
jgi:uncharacterized membrane protein YagU involved in acid resistance